MEPKPIFLLIAAAVAITGCTASPSATTKNGWPMVLRYAAAKSSVEAPDEQSRRHAMTRAYLEREMHMPVELVETTSYGSVIEAFRAKKIDAGSISPFSYILATQSIPLEAIVSRGNDGQGGTYQGVIAVRADSPLHTIDDVIQHAKELTISFVDPASASGFLVQNAYLASKGIKPRKVFKKTVFAQTHPASLLALEAGKVDVAATMLRLVEGYERVGKIAKGSVRVLWTSPGIPNQSIAVRKELPQDFKEALREALIRMPEKDPEAFKTQQVRLIARPAGEVYVAAHDADFDGLRAMARGANMGLLER